MTIRRPVITLALLVLALPITAWANSLSFQTTGGQITANGTVLTINTSTLSSLGGPQGGPVTGNLGIASLTTGALLSGNLATGATFAAGGSFTITGNGTNGVPVGAIFNGSFLSPVTWTAIWNPNAGPGHRGAWYYTLSGTVRGKLNDGGFMTGRISFATTDVPRGAQFSTFANLGNGTGEVAVPEPGTLALLATGLASVAMLVRRRWWN
jgi:hypothetical protein